MRFVKYGMMAALLSTAAFAQEAEVEIKAPTIGGAVSGAGKAVGDSVKEGTQRAVQAAQNVAGGVADAVQPEPADKAKPGDGAPVIMAPDFSAETTVGQVSKIGEDILILQQDQKRLVEIRTLINQVGIENAMALYPELMTGLDTSPIALEAQLTRVRTLNELREEVARASGPTEYEKQLAEEQAANGTTAQGGDDLMNMQISDTGQEMVVASAEPGLTRDDVAAIIEEERLRQQQDEMLEEAPRVGQLIISEIYGANGQMVALVGDGASTYKVRVGDDIPEHGVVSSITRESVVITKDGESTEVRFR